MRRIVRNNDEYSVTKVCKYGEIQISLLHHGNPIELLINRKGKINTTSYPPYCIYLDTYNKLTKELQLVLIPIITITPPIEYD